MDKVDRLLDEKGNDVFSVSPETTVFEAASTMADRHIGALLVLDGGKPVGIFTERDILARVLLVNADPRAMKVAEAMTKDPVVIARDTSVKEAMAIMTERRCRHLPVIENEKLVGLVSIGDCTRWVSRDQDYTIKHLTDYIHRNYPV